LDSLSSLASPIFALLRKLVFPNAPMAVAPSVVLFLIGSFLIGPGLTSNLLLKENWAGRGPTAFGNLPGLPTFSPGGARATPAGGIALSFRERRAKPSGRQRPRVSRRRR
jgi:hypothetical protein